MTEIVSFLYTGSMNTIIGGAPQSSSPRPASRLRPEAEANKDRNKGQGKTSLHSYPIRNAKFRVAVCLSIYWLQYYII